MRQDGDCVKFSPKGPGFVYEKFQMSRVVGFEIADGYLFARIMHDLIIDSSINSPIPRFSWMGLE